ncbi:DUF2760 domain-containing protein [Blastopirellula marina]|uniref:DUF2760 domain-containing protein n=1 Tax=Blastopirellula marina TaxID=124 RepID=A0A2S8FMP4_9BACT|nr:MULTISPECIES: DUF2760 domain-containing protein [Pirellulaceae]PQO33459.1 DUF2760 domain-containing protein [Blastopirellula marina]RCS52549.1 DUF2760 domain-containing protein [Bremerella cremea]
MSRIGLAFKLFFQILFNSEVAQRAESLSLPAPQQEKKPEPPPPPPPPPKAKPPRPDGIDALVLLATLQREARFLDLFQEDLSEYDDAQIGAAVRDVQRDTKATLNRLFAISPVLSEEEGGRIELPASFDASEIRLVGNVQNEKPSGGTLVHRGWRATKCDVPKFNGTLEQAQVLNPAEVEV